MGIHPIILAACLFAATPALARPSGDDAATPAGAGAKAGEAQQKPQAPDALLGDWAASRPGSPVSGSPRCSATRASSARTYRAACGATLDTATLFGLKGGVFQTSITFRHGHDLGQRAGLGTLQQVQEVYAAATRGG